MNIRRTTINLDRDLADDARHALGVATTTEAIHVALRDAVRRWRLEGLRGWQLDGLDLDTLERLRSPRGPVDG